MAKLGEHALVLGGSISGLLAARVLSDFYDTVTVVERDELSETPTNRRGVPQGRHVHALLARGAHTPACLERLGYGRPPEGRIVMHTTYVSQTLKIPPGTLEEMLVTIGPVPGRPAGMFLFRYEKDAWIFTVFGMVGREPPRDLPGMLAYADEFAPPRLVAAVRAGEPITPVVQHRLPSSQWRRYDRMQRFPAGLLVCGDAMCSFNPIYGQGMSVAAMDAIAPREALRGGTADLSRRYFRAAAKSIGVAWNLAAGSDLAFPEVEGHRTPSMRVANRFVQRVLTACETDADVHAQFFKVTGLVDAPTRLFHPAFLYRVARANMRSQQHNSRSKQADLARVGD
ncbi:hypothetical protein [Mycolicibacterium brisbanense]